MTEQISIHERAAPPTPSSRSENERFQVEVAQRSELPSNPIRLQSFTPSTDLYAF